MILISIFPMLHIMIYSRTLDILHYLTSIITLEGKIILSTYEMNTQKHIYLSSLLKYDYILNKMNILLCYVRSVRK